MNDAILSPELVFSAKLVDPSTRYQLDMNQKVDWSSIFSILMRNRVPLLGLIQDPMIANCPLVAQPGFQQAVMNEEESWGSLRDQYSLVRDRLLMLGIPCILFKSVGLAPSFPYTSDNLDVLVPLTEIGTGRKVLTDLGYVELRHIEEPMKFLFRRFLAGECVSAIHLHGFVGWGARFMEEGALWQGCRPSDDDPLVNVPSPEDAVLITIAHAFYENKSFKLLDLVRIRYCFSHGNIDYGYLKWVSKERNWEDGLAFSLLICAQLDKAIFGESRIPDEILVEANRRIERSFWLKRFLKSTLSVKEIHFPFKISFLLGKLFYYRKITTDPQQDVGDRIYNVIGSLAAGIKLKLHIRGQRGMLITLSGIDGSGKTSTAEALLRAFATADILAYPFWIRFGSIARHRKVDPSNRGNTDITSTGVTITSLEKRRIRLRNPVLRLAWLSVNLSYMILLYNLRVRVSTWLGSVVICDRYIYDALAEIEASLPKGSSLLPLSEWLLVHLCPSPGTSWLLDVLPEDAMDRQKDEQHSEAALKELACQRERYLALQERYKINLVNNHGDKDETVTRVVFKTLQTYFENYSTWINGLLFSNPKQMNPEE